MAYRLLIVPKKKRRIMQREQSMRSPYGLEIIEMVPLDLPPRSAGDDAPADSTERS